MELTDICVPVHLIEANTSGVRPGLMAVTSQAHKLKGGDTEVSAACCGAHAVSYKTDKSQFFLICFGAQGLDHFRAKAPHLFKGL